MRWGYQRIIDCADRLTSSDHLAVSSADKYTHDTDSKHCCAITAAHGCAISIADKYTHDTGSKHCCAIGATLYDADTNSDDLASADTYANSDCGTD